MTKVIGLSGGIASGKTTVAGMLESLGAMVINADKIAHEVVGRRAVLRRIIRRWGREMLKTDGTLDRRELADAVFADPKEVRALEAIVHPPVLQEIRRSIRQGRAGGLALIVLDAPLINEAGLGVLCDVQVFVKARANQRCRRAAQDREWTVKDLAQREANQMALSEKRRRAQYVIDNSGTRAATRSQVRRLWTSIVQGS